MTRVFWIAFGWLVAALPPQAARAGCCEPPKTWILGDDLDRAQALRTSPAAHVRLGAFAIRMEEVHLADVSSAAGAGAITDNGLDASGLTYWLCYTLRDARLWVMANGEMGGPEHDVGEIGLVRERGAKPQPGCPALPERMQPVQLIPGVHLGSTAAELSGGLGARLRRSNGTVSYLHELPLKGRERECTVSAWSVARLEQGRVQVLRVGQVTSC
jgi:hypothetical protein